MWGYGYGYGGFCAGETSDVSKQTKFDKGLSNLGQNKTSQKLLKFINKRPFSMTGIASATASSTSASNNTSMTTQSNSAITTNTTTSNIQSPNTGGNPLRKLVGKLVYLDLNNSYKHKNKVKECLQFIEAKLAICFSNEVDFVITDRDIPSNCEATNSQTSTTQPSNEIQNNNEQNKKLKTSPNTLNMFSRTNSLINRTQAILGKAKGSCVDIITIARKIGIIVIHINELECYIEKYFRRKKSLESNEIANGASPNENVNTLLNTKNYLNSPSKLNGPTCEGSSAIVTSSIPNFQSASIKNQYEKLNAKNQKIFKLKSPFLKFESVCKQYKPIYQEFKTWHEINPEPVSALKNYKNSPFCIYYSDDLKNSSSDSNFDDENKEVSSSKKNRVSVNEIETQSQNKTVFKPPTSSTLISSTNQTINKTAKSPSSVITSSKINANSNISNKNSNNPALVLNPIALNKKKPTGYCECCKQRYENLKQHLTSAQHENFEKNQNNFKELDEFINGELNFQKFLNKNNLNMKKNIDEENENVNLDELKEFAKTFKKNRQVMGFTQTDVVESLIKCDFAKEGFCTEETISKFEKLDITPKSGAKMRHILEKWLFNTQLNYEKRTKTCSESPQLIESNLSDLSKKRKRLASFTPKSVQILNEAYKKNKNPTDDDLEILSKKLFNIKPDMIRAWFSNKSKSFNKIKKFKQENVINSLALNSSQTENDTSMSSQVCSPFCITNSSTKNLIGRKSTGNAHNTRQMILGVSQSHVNTPNKQAQILNKHHSKSSFKNSPSKASSLDLSSPTAAILFNSNNNSINFSFINDNLNTTAPSLQNSATKAQLVSKLDLINGTSEIQSITTHGFGANTSTDYEEQINPTFFQIYDHEISYDLIKKLE